jgi:hypothetical protein
MVVVIVIVVAVVIVVIVVVSKVGVRHGGSGIPVMICAYPCENARRMQARRLPEQGRFDAARASFGRP